MNRAHAYRQIDAAKVASTLSPLGDISSERVARELGSLEPEAARAAWTVTVERHGPEPTAAEVREVVAAARKRTRRRPPLVRWVLGVRRSARRALPCSIPLRPRPSSWLTSRGNLPELPNRRTCRPVARFSLHSADADATLSPSIHEARDVVSARASDTDEETIDASARIQPAPTDTPHTRLHQVDGFLRPRRN